MTMWPLFHIAYGVCMEPTKLISSISYQDIQLLNQIGQDFSSYLDFDKVINTIMTRVKAVLRCEASSVILYDEEEKSLVFYAASGIGSRKVRGLKVPRGKGFVWWVYEHQQPVVVEDSLKDERFYSGIDKITHMRTTSLICVPIRKKDRVLGVIEGINKMDGGFTEGDLDLLTSISQFAGISIENSIIHKNLAEKNKKLAMLNKEMEEFVHIVSHDLQTPIASIEGYVDLIKSEMKEILDSNTDLNTYITRIEENCKHTFHFIRRLLSFIKLSDSNISVQEFDPAKVLDDVLVVLEDDIRSTHAKIVDNLHIKRVSFDRSIFYHILLNLIQNSLKYAVTEKKPLIEIGDKEEEDGWVHFFIRDNGPGISKGDRERIFKFYERGNSLGPVDGFGVGLAFVKKAVEMFDGKVWLETEKDKGSTFYFSIKR
jgi:signal transduction histidine kinase